MIRKYRRIIVYMSLFILLALFLYQWRVNHNIWLSLRFPFLLFMILLLLAIILIVSLAMADLRKYSIGLDSPVDIPETPRLSVIIPARNEELNIRRCLESLKKVEYPNLEIIVIDDNSTDRTWEIITEKALIDNRIKAIKAGEIPYGWLGKLNALHRGISQATGKWLLMLDVDVAVNSKAPEIALSHCLKNGFEMLSILPNPSLEDFWGGVIMTVIFGSLSLSLFLRESNSPKNKLAMANGGFILIKTSTYKAIGGYEAIKNYRTDDVELAKLAKANGITCRFLVSRGIASQRWYSRFLQTWRGWSRNFFSGLGFNMANTIKIIIRLFVSNVLPPVILLYQLAKMLSGDNYWPLMLLITLAQTLVLITYWLYSNVRLGIKVRYCLLYPLGVSIYIGIIINSILKELMRRDIIWRERRVNSKDS